MRVIHLCVALSLTLMISACADTAVPIGAGAPPAANRGAQSGEEAMAQVVFVVPLEGAPSQTALILADASLQSFAVISARQFYRSNPTRQARPWSAA